MTLTGSMPRRVAITGIGVVSPLGPYPGTFWEQLLRGVSGTRAIERFDASDLPCRIAGTIDDFDATPYLRNARDVMMLDRTSQLAVVAAELARRDARLETDSLSRAAVLVGSGFGCIGTLLHFCSAYHEEGARSVRATAIPKGMSNAPAAAISMNLSARGPHWVIASACASGTIAIGNAARLVAAGHVPIAIAGGADAPVLHATLASWCSMRVLSRRNDTPRSACRPFSADRDGFVLAEGAAMLVLEDLAIVRERGSAIYAEVTGYAESSDAGHLTTPSVAGEVRAIRGALASAELQGDDIDYVNAHGTATLINDRIEALALREALGPRANSIPMSATKSMTGHAMGASGAMEVAATALAVRDQLIHPTANLREKDPECQLDFAAEGKRSVGIRHALKTSFAFGGANAAIILSRSVQ